MFYLSLRILKRANFSSEAKRLKSRKKLKRSNLYCQSMYYIQIERQLFFYFFFYFIYKNRSTPTRGSKIFVCFSPHCISLVVGMANTLFDLTFIGGLYLRKLALKKRQFDALNILCWYGPKRVIFYTIRNRNFFHR